MCPRFNSGRRHHFFWRVKTLELLVNIVYWISCLFIILVILIQGGNQGGVGAAFGGGNTQGVFGASGATSLLAKLTFVAGICFVVTCISLSVMQGQGGKVGLYEKVKAEKERISGSESSSEESQPTESQ